MDVTGIRSKIETDFSSIIKKIQLVSDIPVAVGFGVNTPEQAADIVRFADDVIVGSAIVKIIEEHKEHAGVYIYDYIKQINSYVAPR
jgi:tryptophan synthase alpha chain